MGLIAPNRYQVWFTGYLASTRWAGPVLSTFSTSSQQSCCKQPHQWYASAVIQLVCAIAFVKTCNNLCENLCKNWKRSINQGLKSIIFSRLCLYLSRTASLSARLSSRIPVLLIAPLGQIILWYPCCCMCFILCLFDSLVSSNRHPTGLCPASPREATLGHLKWDSHYHSSMNHICELVTLGGSWRRSGLCCAHLVTDLLVSRV